MTSMNVLDCSISTNRIEQRLGNYQLLEVLGQGGFATVYLGKHRYLDTYAAVKVLNTQLTYDEVEEFFVEARTAARMIHPNIVRVLEFGLEDNMPFLVTDYALHGTLRQQYRKGSMLPLKVVLMYVQQIACALQFIHNCQVIHQDIKPANILVGGNNQLLLSDFGISVVAYKASTFSTRKRVGTVAYMAPEQIQGKPCFASDQYALGVVVYEWLCGETPFQGSVVEIATKQLQEHPSPLQKKVSTIPTAVEQVVMRTLAKDSQQRFPNVQAFAAALECASKDTEKKSSSLFCSGVTLNSSLNSAKPTIPPKPHINKRRKGTVKKAGNWKVIIITFMTGLLLGAIASVILNIQNVGLLICVCFAIVLVLVQPDGRKGTSSRHA